MNKAQLVAALARESGSSKLAAERNLNDLLACLAAGLRRDRTVTIAGFGTFRVNRRKGHVGTNPRTGERMRIPASRHVAFKCGKNLKASL